jgi:hypothetical protein
MSSVRVWSRPIGLTVSKLPDKGQRWLRENERRLRGEAGLGARARPIRI